MSTRKDQQFASKPPEGALVKSQGAERSGNHASRMRAGMDIRA